MGKLEKLISELCPDGVEYKTIGEIAVDIYRGSGIKRDEVTETGIQCVRYGEIYTTYGIWFDKCVSHTTVENVKSPKYFEQGDILFAITGENIDEIAKSCAYIGDEKCLAGGDIVVLKHNQNPKYLSYALSTSEAQKQKSSGRVKSKVVHSNVPAIKAIKIPVPPIEVQSEIVRILDNFTELTAELTAELIAELTARKKQYEYYRDSLLDNADNARILDLGEIAKIKNGKDYKSLGEGSIPVYGSGGIMTYVDEFAYNKPTVLIPRKGSIDKLYYVETPFWNVDTIFYTDINCDVVIPKYLFYLLQKEHLEQYNTAGGVPSLTQGVLNKVQLLVPSLAEQQRIVDILDRFDALCSDISTGLPDEIEARQKQYDYYRDKLLAFESIK